MKLLSLTCTLLSLLSWLVISANNAWTQENVSTRIAPAIHAHTLDGKAISLDDYRGKTLVLVFWAPWCITCPAEMLHLEKLYRRPEPRNLTVLAVTVGSTEKQIAEYVERYKITFPVAIGPKEEIAALYTVEQLPAAVVIDERGFLLSPPSAGPAPPNSPTIEKATHWPLAEVFKLIAKSARK